MRTWKAMISVDTIKEAEASGNSEARNVIVLSRNYSTGLGLIRSLGEAGYRVELLASARRRHSSSIASASRYAVSAKEFLKPDILNDDGEDIVQYLLRRASEDDAKNSVPTVLFPADDYTASVLDKNRERLKTHFLLPTIGENGEGSIVRYMDKGVQGELAREAGLSRPRELTVSLEGDIAIPGDVPFPCFVKPLKSVDGEKQEMVRCGGKDELVEALKALKKSFSERSVLIQEYLNIEKEYDVGGVCLGDKIVIPAVIEKTGVAGYERGVTMTGRMVSRDVLKDVLESLERMLKKMNYSGMFDLEFILADRRLYFNEINFRSGGPHFAYCLNGVNLPSIFVKGITGEDITRENCEIAALGKTFVYEKVAWEDYINGYMTFPRLKQIISEADFTLLENEDDPAPGRIFRRKIRLSALKHRVKRLIGR